MRQSAATERREVGRRSGHDGGLAAFVLALTPLEWAIPVALGALAVRAWLQDAAFALDRFPGRTVGVAVLHALDVERRTNELLVAAALFVTCVAAALLVGWSVSRLAKTRVGDAGHSAHLRRALGPAHGAAGLALAAIVFLPPGHGALVEARVLLNVCGVLALLGTVHAVPILQGARSGRSTAALNIALATAAWGAAYTLDVVVGRRSGQGTAFLVTGWALTILALLGAPRLMTRWRIDTRSAGPMLLVLALLPLAGFVAQEAGYALLLRVGSAPRFRWIELVLVFATLGAASMLLRRRAGGAGPALRARLVSRRLIPAVIAAVAIIAAWVPAGHGYPIDFFHDGESALPAHQLIRFGAVPYVDLFPTHGLAVSYLGGLLHALLDGTVSLDARVALGDPLLRAAGCVLLYMLVRRLTGSLTLAIWVVTLMPGLPEWQMPTGYTAAIPAVLALVAAAARPVPRSFALVGLCGVLALAVRVDAGVMTIAACSVVVTALALTAWSRGERVWARIVLPSVAPMLIVAVSAAVALLASPSLRTLVPAVREFISLGFQSMSMGILQLTSPLVSRPASQSVLIALPALTLVMSAPLALRALRRALGGGCGAPVMGLMAFVLYNVLVLTRALGRHTEGEISSVGGFVSSYSVLLVLLLARQWMVSALHGRAPLRWVLAAVVTFDGLVGMPAPGLLDVALAAPGHPLTDMPQVMGPWSPRFPQGGPRDEGFRALGASLANRLAPGETFVELAHEPSLFVALDRKFPGYVVPILYATSETSQRTLLERVGKERVRLAVLRDRWFWSSVDGVSDAVRSWRVHEWVNAGFPSTLESGPYVLAVSRDADAPRGTERRAPPDGLAEVAEVGQLPWLWANRDPLRALEKTPVLRDLLGEAGILSVPLAPRSTRPLAIAPRVVPPAAYFRVDVEAPGPALMRLGYRPDHSATPSGMTFEVRAGRASYLLRISGLRTWSTGPAPAEIELENASDIPLTIRKLELRAGD